MRSSTAGLPFFLIMTRWGWTILLTMARVSASSCLIGLRVRAFELLERLFQLPVPHGFEILPDLGDEGVHLELFEPEAEPLHLFVHDRMGLLRFLHPVRKVGLGKPFEIVDVVEVDVLNIVHRWLDVPGYGDIDEEEGAVLSALHGIGAPWPCR